MSFIVKNKINEIEKPNKILCKTTMSNKFIGIDSDYNKQEPTKKISLDANTDDKFQIVPNINTEREVIFISGSSGSGKSFFIKQYIKEYKRVHPKNKIWLISVLDDNEFSKYGCKKIDVIKLVQVMPEIKDLMKDLANSLIIFDDSDSFKDKSIKGFVWGLLDNIAQTGRHFNISMCVSSHVLSNYSQTKLILLESHRVVVFMNNYNLKMKMFLETYCNLDKNVINKLKNVKSRWICINKSYPISWISEKQMEIVNNNDEEIADAIEIIEKKNKKIKKMNQEPISVNTA